MNSKQLKIELSIDLGNPVEVEAFNAFTAALSGQEAPEPKAKPAAKPKPTAKSKPAPAKPKPAPKAKAPAKSKPAPAKEEASEEAEYSKDDVKKLLAEKVQDFRTEIKVKLGELGAAKLSELDEADYSEFMDFLNGLKK